MTNERKPELIIVDTLKDKHGRTVKVGYRGADVEIIVTPHSGHDGRMAFDGEQRDRFIKAWAEAEKLAEGQAPGRPVATSSSRPPASSSASPTASSKECEASQ
jgi:hypothetical protein